MSFLLKVKWQPCSQQTRKHQFTSSGRAATPTMTTMTYLKPVKKAAVPWRTISPAKEEEETQGVVGLLHDESNGEYEFLLKASSGKVSIEKIIPVYIFFLKEEEVGVEKNVWTPGQQNLMKWQRIMNQGGKKGRRQTAREKGERN